MEEPESGAAPTSVQDGCVVTIRFSLFSEDGEELHESPSDDPLEYLHGAGNILTGLEECLSGKAVSDTFDLVLPPDKAFGVSDPTKVQYVPREAFPSDAQLEVGMQFGAEDQDGTVVPVWITSVEADRVTINGNHPLSDQSLRCEGEVLAIRRATSEEIEHGHVHGEGHVH